MINQFSWINWPEARSASWLELRIWWLVACALMGTELQTSKRRKISKRAWNWIGGRVVMSSGSVGVGDN